MVLERSLHRNYRAKGIIHFSRLAGAFHELVNLTSCIPVRRDLSMLNCTSTNQNQLLLYDTKISLAQIRRPLRTLPPPSLISSPSVHFTHRAPHTHSPPLHDKGALYTHYSTATDCGRSTAAAEGRYVRSAAMCCDWDVSVRVFHETAVHTPRAPTPSATQ